MPDTFQAITQDVRREVQEKLESEGKLNTITNADLKNHIGDMLKEVLGIEKISNDRIEEVMFLSESEKKTSGSESDVSVSNDAKEKNEEEKAKKEESDGTAEEFDPENDVMLFIDDEDTILFNDMKDVDRLKILNQVNNMTKFPKYKPQGTDTIVDIVMKSVGLMRLLNSNKKLVKSEVEETEDMIREVKAEIFRENWLKAGGGG